MSTPLVAALVALEAKAPMKVVVAGETVELNQTPLSVGDLLIEQNINVGPYDRVDPGLGAPVRDGMRIEIDRARPLLIDDNGNIRTVWTTANTVGQVLSELRRQPAKVDPPASTPVDVGATVVLRDSMKVTLTADGQQQAVDTTAINVAEFLRQQGLAIDDNDIVSPSAQTPVSPGLAVVVQRVIDEQVIEETELAFETEKQADPSLPKGKSVTVTAGRNGRMRSVYRVLTHDGEQVGKELIDRQQIEPPVNAVVRVGSATPATVTTVAPKASATAKTEPAKTDPAKSVSPTTVAPVAGAVTVAEVDPAAVAATTTTGPIATSGKATWYRAPTPGGCAHRRLPKGTTVTVTNTRTGATATCLVNDRGPYGGAIIDLAPDVFKKLGTLEQGVVDVALSW